VIDMSELPTICRAHDLIAEIAEARKRRSLILERSAKLLEASRPDTFLGRRRHTPIPPPSQDDEQSGPGHL
jgi:hypothetical protein